MAWVRSCGRCAGDHQRPNRLHRPSRPFCAPRPGRYIAARCCRRVHRSDLPRRRRSWHPPVHWRRPDPAAAICGARPAPERPVPSMPPGRRPRTPQPVRQGPAYPATVCRELLHSHQAAARIHRGGDWVSAWYPRARDARASSDPKIALRGPGGTPGRSLRSRVPHGGSLAAPSLWRRVGISNGRDVQAIIRSTVKSGPCLSRSLSRLCMRGPAGGVLARCRSSLLGSHIACPG